MRASSSTSSVRCAAKSLIVCAVAAALPACVKSAPAVTPQVGRITVGVTTRAPSPTALASLVFMVDIQPRGTPEPIKADGGLYDTDLPPGDYVVRLAELPGACGVDGAAERRVTVSARRTTAVRFSVTCR